MGLADYKDIVGKTAGICTVAQIFAPAFICKDIVKQGSTKNIAVGPFVGGLAMSLIVLRYGLILNDPAMIPVNISGLILNLIYLSIFYYYSDKKGELVQNIIKVLLAVGTIIGYSLIESKERIEFTYGLIVTVIMLVLIGAPLLDLKKIIATKDTGSLPFPLIVSGTVVTFLWLLYGIIIENAFIQFQNIVAFTLCITQLSLFVIYPSKPKLDAKHKKAD